MLTDTNRSTSPSRWPSNSFSGSFLSSMFPLSPYRYRGSSSVRSSLPLSSLLRSFYRVICTLALLGLQQRLVGRELPSFRLLLVQLRRQRVCRSCSRSFWRCWARFWGCGCVCRGYIRRLSSREEGCARQRYEVADEADTNVELMIYAGSQEPEPAFFILDRMKDVARRSDQLPSPLEVPCPVSGISTFPYPDKMTLQPFISHS
jgi:hypothetical protein